MQSRWWTGTYPLTQGYGKTTYAAEPPAHGAAHWHTGLDFALPEPTPLVAGFSGTVVEKGLAGYGAQSVRFTADGGAYDAVLGHLDSSVGVGTHLNENDPLGASGGADNDDGNSSGAHLHFEIRIPPTARYGVNDVDPTRWLLGEDMQADERKWLKAVYDEIAAKPNYRAGFDQIYDGLLQWQKQAGAALPPDVQDAIKIIAAHIK